MIDPKNNGNITGGLVADPETITTAKGNQIVKLRLAADYAGSEGGKSATGYFDITYFPSDSPNSHFVMRQITDGKMKKGSQLQVLYRLNQERFQVEGKNRSSVVLVAEAITYAGSARPEGDADTTERSSAEAAPAFAAPDRW